VSLHRTWNIFDNDLEQRRAPRVRSERHGMIDELPNRESHRMAASTLLQSPTHSLFFVFRYNLLRPLNVGSCPPVIRSAPMASTSSPLPSASSSPRQATSPLSRGSSRHLVSEVFKPKLPLDPFIAMPEPWSLKLDNVVSAMNAHNRRDVLLILGGMLHFLINRT
jgi:hypothetical protein